MIKTTPASCEKCNKQAKSYKRMYGKNLCLKCMLEFYTQIRPIIEKDVRVKKQFKKWFFEMELEEY